jgi:hypothetical protein
MPAVASDTRRLISVRVVAPGEGVARIEALCARCGCVAETTFWSRAVNHGAVHEHQPVRVHGVMTRREWCEMPRRYRSTRPRRVGGQYSEHHALHLDSDGSTILIPVELR